KEPLGAYDGGGVVRPLPAASMLDLGGGRTPFAILMAASTALLGFDLGARVLATNDEARFPMMARDILANGHWLLPEISGVPMLNKPPLHAWLIALGAWPPGAASQRTAVVPSFLGARRRAGAPGGV